MTEKLFENDSFLLKGKCTVTSCKAVDGGFAVITDKTLFSPKAAVSPETEDGWAKAGCLTHGLTSRGK